MTERMVEAVCWVVFGVAVCVVLAFIVGAHDHVAEKRIEKNAECEEHREDVRARERLAQECIAHGPCDLKDFP